LSRPGIFVSLADAIAKARCLVADLGAVGIHPKESSRLLSYVRTLVEAEEQRWIKDFGRYLFAYQEIPLLGSIFAFLKEPPHPKADWREAFRKILSGHYFPGVGDGRARDTQAELFFASLAKSLGYGVELGDSRLRDSGLGEPDVVISNGAPGLRLRLNGPIHPALSAAK